MEKRTRGKGVGGEERTEGRARERRCGG